MARYRSPNSIYEPDIRNRSMSSTKRSRERLDADIEKYLKSGGQIYQCKVNESANSTKWIINHDKPSE